MNRCVFSTQMPFCDQYLFFCLMPKDIWKSLAILSQVFIQNSFFYLKCLVLFKTEIVLNIIFLRSFTYFSISCANIFENESFLSQALISVVQNWNCIVYNFLMWYFKFKELHWFNFECMFVFILYFYFKSEIHTKLNINSFVKYIQRQFIWYIRW